jgi:hypothetical protein
MSSNIHFEVGGHKIDETYEKWIDLWKEMTAQSNDKSEKKVRDPHSRTKVRDRLRKKLDAKSSVST